MDLGVMAMKGYSTHLRFPEPGPCHQMEYLGLPTHFEERSILPRCRRYSQRFYTLLTEYCSVGWGCWIHRLYFCREVRSAPTNECPGHDTKHSDSAVPVMLELWRKQSTPSFSSLPGRIWPRVVTPDRVLSMGQIELNCTYAKLYCFK